MRLNYAGRLMGRDPEKARVELSISEDMARRATQDIRHMLFSLRPLILELQGLAAALWQLGKKIEETRGQRVVVEADLEAGKDLDPLHQSVIFYIAEEGLNNAVKHAQAQHVWIRLQPQAGMWLLEVEDDGVGFNVGAVDEDYAQRGSLGLVNMRERAALVGAQLVIEFSRRPRHTAAACDTSAGPEPGPNAIGPGHAESDVNVASASKRTWLQRAGWLSLGAATFVWLVTEGRSLTIPLLLAGSSDSRPDSQVRKTLGRPGGPGLVDRGASRTDGSGSWRHGAVRRGGPDPQQDIAARSSDS